MAKTNKQTTITKAEHITFCNKTKSKKERGHTTFSKMVSRLHFCLSPDTQHTLSFDLPIVQLWAFLENRVTPAFLSKAGLQSWEWLPLQTRPPPRPVSRFSSSALSIFVWLGAHTVTLPEGTARFENGRTGASQSSSLGSGLAQHLGCTCRQMWAWEKSSFEEPALPWLAQLVPAFSKPVLYLFQLWFFWASPAAHITASF